MMVSTRNELVGTKAKTLESSTEEEIQSRNITKSATQRALREAFIEFIVGKMWPEWKQQHVHLKSDFWGLLGFALLLIHVLSLKGVRWVIKGQGAELRLIPSLL